MKVRAQRTHFMGASNRNKSNFDQNYKGKTVFERSFNKSRSLYGQPDASKFLQLNSSLKQNQSAVDGRVKPFLGTHNQYETKRFDKNNKRQYKHSKMVLAPTQKILDLGLQLNRQIKGIQQEFKDKRINMHKLQELKRTFVKNNRQKRNMKQYFQTFANSQGFIDNSGMRKLVKEYGFDVNLSEIDLIFKLSKRHGAVEGQGLPISGFVELMTKEDVFYNTLKISQDPNFTFGQPPKHFSAPVHQVLRNKFPKLKEAFKIYKQRDEEIDYEKYAYVMKKMDLTDLVLPVSERQKIFHDYSQNGYFNVEGFVCAIAEQEHGKAVKLSPAVDFSDNLRTNQQKNHRLMQKARNSSLKNMSSLEYEKELEKAGQVLDELRSIIKNKNKEQKKSELLKILRKQISNRQQVATKLQNLMKEKGINFQKEQYDAFLAYLDFDVRGQISSDRIYKNVFEETQKQAQDRFERKLRNEAPKNTTHHSDMICYDDQDTALRCIRKIKDHKMNPENKQLFNYFDQDKDGYIETSEFVQKLQEMKILDNWQINALTGYLDSENNGALDFKTFTKKFNKEDSPLSQLPQVKTVSSRSYSEWKNSNLTSTKKNMIKTMNKVSYQRPTQFSAWPQRLLRSDLSLIQPPVHSGMYASDHDRFSQRKQQYGLKQKMRVNSIKQKKVQKLAEWNQKVNANIQAARQKQQDRQAARNYALRLTQQKYEENCHRKFP